MIAAWSVFSRAGRETLRAALGSMTARGSEPPPALRQAALIIPYYAGTNPEFAGLARRTAGEVFADVRV